MRVRLESLLLCATAATLFAAVSHAQRHSGMASPPTAPPGAFAHSASLPVPTTPSVSAVSSGLGPMQFYPVAVTVPAPQSITRQLESDDERTRLSALAAVGVPGQYLAKGHVPYPHSTELELAPLGTSEDLDALLTVELDHHLVTAVLMPENGEWKRIATMIFPTAFADPSSTPSTFLRTTRSLLQPTRYRAVFRARETQANGDYTENEAHLRILNNRALVTVSFVSDARNCEPAKDEKHGKGTCELTERWLQPDTSQPGVRRFTLVSASGTLSPKDAENPLSTSRNYQLAHLRNYSCQPFIFSDADLRYEPSGPSLACKK